MANKRPTKRASASTKKPKRPPPRPAAAQAAQAGPPPAAKRARKPGKNVAPGEITRPAPPPAEQPLLEVRPELDSDPFGDDGLTVRHRLFVAAMVGPAGGNATKAAQLAGYSVDNTRAAQVTASRLMDLPSIQEAISHALAKRRASPEWARLQIIDLARSSMANFVGVNDEGELAIDFLKAKQAAALGQIKEIREEVIKAKGNDADDGEAVISRTIKVHDRTAALRLLATIHGMTTPKDEEKEPEKLTVRIRRMPTGGTGAAGG